MKVIHVIPFLWSGAGRVLTDLCISQSTHHDVTIVTSGNAKGMSDWPFYRRRFSANGIEHRRIDFFDSDPAVYWKSVRQLDDCIRTTSGRCALSFRRTRVRGSVSP